MTPALQVRIAGATQAGKPPDGETRSQPACEWRAWWSVAAARYGTPLYAYDLPLLRAGAEALHRALGAYVRVHYALKANGSLALVAELRRLGCGADICSLGELELARAAGVGAGDTLYTGPAKSDLEIAEAISWGVGLIVVESVEEATRVAAAALRRDVRQRVLLRVNPGSRFTCSGLALTAPTCKFGVDEVDAPAAARQIQTMTGVELRGIHVCTESNVSEAEPLLARARWALELAASLRRGGVDVGVVDLGGGLGVPTLVGDARFDLGTYAAGLRRLAADHPRVSLILELGRYPVGACGTYVVSVTGVKRSRGNTFALADGGINHLYRPRLTRRERPPTVLAGTRAPLERVTVAGPLLDSEDVLAEGVLLPRPELGDLLAIPGCGAYGYGHGLQGFCLHPTPVEVAWDGYQIHLIRERGDPSKVTSGQRLPLDRSISAAASELARSGS